MGTGYFNLNRELYEANLQNIEAAEHREAGLVQLSDYLSSHDDMLIEEAFKNLSDKDYSEKGSSDMDYISYEDFAEVANRLGFNYLSRETSIMKDRDIQQFRRESNDDYLDYIEERQAIYGKDVW